MGEFLQSTYFDNRVIDYLLALILIIGGSGIISVLKRVIFRRFINITRKTPSSLHDFILQLIDKELLPLLYYIALYMGCSILALPPSVDKAIQIIGSAVFVFVGVRVIMAIVAYSIELYLAKNGEDGTKQNVAKGVEAVLRVIIWGLAVIIFLENLGVEITALVAGLGIGGIAVALAAQTILGDLFSYITIYFDRPFAIGDYINVGEFNGTVEYIGIKTTRLRSLSGEQIIMANSDLTASRLRNYKRMEQRRISFRLRVTYDTDLDRLKEIPEIIRAIIESFADTRFDRAHFAAFGDYGLEFEVVYFVLTSDYRRYMDIQQEINLRLLEEFEQRGIKLALPTQMLHVVR